MFLPTVCIKNKDVKMLLCEKVKKEIFSQKIYFVKIRDIWIVAEFVSTKISIFQHWTKCFEY